MHVFPGGGVQDSDFAPVPWIGPSARSWAERLHCQEGLAQALVVAAVREVFEETCLLLAGPDETSVMGDVGDLAAARPSLESKQMTFGEFLREHGLCLRADLLSAWAHWITPEFEPRRFDTRFFVVMLPAGQSVGGLTTESDQGEWVGIERALALVRDGTMEMMRPTRQTLQQLLDVGGRPLAEAAASRTITTFAPRLVEIDGVSYLDGPGDEQL
jgi:8-oxo-dGTP pyrophosphatase MutT (NUDIX family)